MVHLFRILGLITSMTVCISYILYISILKNHAQYFPRPNENRYTFAISKRYKQLDVSSTESSTKKVTEAQMKEQIPVLPKVMNSIKYRTRLWEKPLSFDNLNLRLKNVKKNYQTMNTYNVTFQGKINQSHNPHDLLCQLKHRVDMTMLKSSDLPDSARNWSQYIPNKDIHEVVEKLKRCAVVSSAGSMKGSRLGQEIDSHDTVIRFNAAPTKGFETDVGSKTTIRIINSQVVTQREHNFLVDPIFKDIILVLWDPSPYDADTYQWYKKPEYNFTEPYRKYRMVNPEQPFYILKPQTLWQLWDIIQENSPELIQPNPPSSGYLGIMLMMNICDEVNLYEFLPSSRQTARCYYYKDYFDTACTFGAYHPLIYEKNIIKKLNQGTEDDIYKNGKVTLPGIRNLQCSTPTQ